MAADERRLASTATKKCDENVEKDLMACHEEVVFQKPPSGKQSRTNCQANTMTVVKTNHLLFEPAPPLSQTRPFRHHKSHYRRIQSAHGRIGTPPVLENHRHVNSIDLPGRTRPKSAVEPGGEDLSSSDTGNVRLYPTKTEIAPVPKHFLTFDVSEKSRTSLNGCITRQSERTTLNHSHKLDKARDGGKKSKPSRLIPQGIIQLSPWLTDDAPEEVCGVDAKTCLIFLPCLSDIDELLPELPSVQHSDECVIPYTVLPPSPKPFDPKKLFHYDVERHIQEAEALYDRRNIYSVDGRLLHEEKRYSRHRSADIIRKEIYDLERLLAGIGCADGNSIVVQYQEEINTLKKSVRETLARCPKYKEEPEKEPPDVTGLRAFIREREEVIAKIKARGEACLAELDSLALEANIGMTMQKEVLDALKNL